MEAFPETSGLLTRVKGIAKELSEVFMVRVVDKGAGQLWGFCNQWVWDCTEQLLIHRGYLRDNQTHQASMQEIGLLVQPVG